MKKQQKKKHPPGKLKGAYLQQKTKTNEQKKTERGVRYNEQISRVSGHFA